MPGGFALAALSHALRTRIRSAISDSADVQQTGQFDIVTKAPDQLAGSNAARTTVTIYPWKLVPSPSWESSRQAGYSAAGERRANRLLALDVLYVLGAYAQDNANAEGVLGLALLGLHETPQLSREMFNLMAAGTFPAGSALPQALRELATQPAPVSIEPLIYDNEEFSQVWSNFNSGVRTGMFYRVGTILMESTRRAASAPPVREGRLSVTLLRAPQIERMLFAPTSAGPFVERPIAIPGEVLRLEGSGLKGEITAVFVGAVGIATAPATTRSDTLEVTLPATLRPGLVSVQVVQNWPKPSGKLPPPAAGSIPGERSNLLPVAIRPVLRAVNPITIGNRQQATDGTVSFDVTVRLAVNVGNRQRCELMLNATAAGGDGRFASFAFSAPDPAPGVAEASVNNRVIPIRGVRPGQYLVRVVIDGAESALAEDATGIVGPLLAVPA